MVKVNLDQLRITPRACHREPRFGGANTLETPVSKSDDGPYTMRYLRYYNGVEHLEGEEDCCRQRVLSKDHARKLIETWNRQGVLKPELGVWSYVMLSVRLEK